MTRYLSLKRRQNNNLRKQTSFIMLSIWLLGNSSCSSKSNDKATETQYNPKEMSITSETLQQVLDAFNRHDLDTIMSFFSEDCSFDFPRGPEPWGQRFTGKAQVREALASRFKGIPDVHYGEDRHWVSVDGYRGVSEWILTGTTTTGIRLAVRGCDLWEFRDGKIIRKDSYWKIVEPAAMGMNKINN
jgi:steroid delta-isomerase-like uncharacterized protein